MAKKTRLAKAAAATMAPRSTPRRAAASAASAAAAAAATRDEEASTASETSYDGADVEEDNGASADEDRTEGSVIYIGLKDFMTFREVVLKPGLGFNVVVGPNGAGKSTIVSALTLGLGGDVSMLRRQARLDEFINTETEADCAKIRIKLQGGRDRDHKPYDIKCQISRKASAPSFWIDGQASNKAAVAELARRLQIQTDNLCQFLPQDVVREFPEMSPSKIFHSTVRAVGDQKTLDLHSRLVQLRNECMETRDRIATKRDTQSTLRSKMQANRGVMEDIRKRTQKQALLRKMEKRKKYLDSKKLYERIQSLKAETAEVEKDREVKEAAHEKLKTSLEEYERKKKVFEMDIGDLGKQVAKLNTALRNSQVEKKDDEVTDVVEKIARHSADAKARKKKLADMKKQREEIQKEMSRLDGLDLGPKLAALQKELEGINRKTEAKRLEKSGKVGERSEVDGRRMAKMTQLKSLESYEVKMLRVLGQRNQDAASGVNCLRSVNARDRFAGPVHEPLLVCLRIKDEACATYVEKLVGNADLESFVCEEARDASSLMNLLRKEKGLRKINVVHSAPAPAGSFSRPPMPDVLKPSFVNYLVDMVDCPLAVQTYLVKRKNFNNIPVFKDDADTAEAERNFRKFFVGKKLYTVKKSRYSADSLTLIEDLRNERPSCFLECPDMERVETLRAEITDDDNVIASIQRDLNEIDRELKDLMAFSTRKSAESEGIRLQVQEKVKKARELTRLDASIAEYQKSSAGNTDMATLLLDRKLAVLKLTQALPIATSTGVTKTIEQEERKLALDRLVASHARDADALKKSENEVKAAQKALSEMENESKQIKQQFQKLYSELEYVTRDGKKTMLIPKHVKESLDSECPKQINDVKARIEALELELSDLPNHPPDKVASVMELEKQVKDSEGAIEVMARELDAKKRHAEKMNKDLTARVKKLVSKINGRFSDMMEAFGNTGSVELEGNSMDPAEVAEDRPVRRGAANTAGNKQEYKLNIMAKFAHSNSDGVQRLSGSVQSGGEKSVITALYMMALQESTQVPFRCVDEINQGMDERNERLIWDQLLDTSKKYSAQYFYLAPKFPRHLNFNEDVTVVLCVNGAIRKRRSNFDVASVAKKLRSSR